MADNNKRYRQALYLRQPLHFQCSQCGACCTANAEQHVFVDRLWAEKIRLFLGLSRAWFRRRYLARVDDMLVLQSGSDGRCVFLEENGRCRVYPLRPVQCSSYPFWPELVKTAKAWQQESRRCEGIDQGDAVPVVAIEAALVRCLKDERAQMDGQ